MKINSTNSNRTIVSANIGIPEQDLKNSFLKRFVLSQGKSYSRLFTIAIVYDWVSRITFKKKNFLRRAIYQKLDLK